MSESSPVPTNGPNPADQQIQAQGLAQKLRVRRLIHAQDQMHEPSVEDLLRGLDGNRPYPGRVSPNRMLIIIACVLLIILFLLLALAVSHFIFHWF
jgi:hypothetical protein